MIERYKPRDQLRDVLRDILIEREKNTHASAAAAALFAAEVRRAPVLAEAAFGRGGTAEVDAFFLFVVMAVEAEVDWRGAEAQSARPPWSPNQPTSVASRPLILRREKEGPSRGVRTRTIHQEHTGEFAERLT